MAGVVTGYELHETENTEIVVFYNNLQADLWTLENDFARPLPYRYTTKNEDFYFSPFVDKTDKDVRIGTWKITGDELIIVWTIGIQGGASTYTDHYKRIPNNEIDRWVEICKNTPIK